MVLYCYSRFFHMF